MRRTVASEVRRVCLMAAASQGTTAFTGYRDKPVEFFAEVLGAPLIPEQAEIARALVVHDWVTVASGRCIGKSFLAAGLALWFCLTRPDSRVVLTAPKAESIQDIVWYELRRLHRGAKIDLGGDLNLLASTGFRCDDGREIFGRTAKSAEAFQGIRGRTTMFVADEASDVEDYIFQAIVGNLAGGGKLLLTSNPTKTTGFFYESHKSPHFKPFQLPTTCSPNIKAGKEVIPGLAVPAFLESCKVAYGSEDSALWKIFVEGKFVEGVEGRLFPPSRIFDAEKRWHLAQPTGRLVVGVDPAGDGSDGDESAFVARRGLKVVWMHSKRGMSIDDHVVEILGLLLTHRGDSTEIPVVVLDRDGPIGAKVYFALMAYLEQHKDAFKVVGVRGSENAKRRPIDYYHVRDEMWYGLVDWMKSGGGIPTHGQLEGDLAAIKMVDMIKGRAVIIKKKDIRKELGRSPDLGDALCLSAYDSDTWIEDDARAGIDELPDRNRKPMGMGAGGVLDPYALLDSVQRRR